MIVRGIVSVWRVLQRYVVHRDEKREEEKVKSGENGRISYVAVLDLVKVTREERERGE